MRGDLLDVLLVVAAVLFAVSGYRRGFVVGVLSFVGLIGGGVLGARLAPGVAESSALGSVDDAVVGLGVVLVLAIVGQVLATAIGVRLRDGLTWRPARLLDAAAGALLSVGGLLLVAWLVGLAVASAPSPALAGQVRRSIVIATVDAAVPDAARRSFDGLRDLVDERGFPDVFGALAPTRAPQVDPPDPALAASPAVVGARPEVLRVSGVAEQCSRRVAGTGFLYAPERVMTNAHVLAGVDEPLVELADGSTLPGRVVLFDPERDVAVLAVDGLEGDPLPFGGPARDGQSALVVGYPQGGPFRAEPARVRETQRARGPDIYGDTTVEREVLALRARVLPGNSGGPLLDDSGQVLGVVFAAAADSADTGYALTAAEVAGDAAAGRAATATVDTLDCD